MGKRGATSTSTGANTEPMPFIRKFGNEGEDNGQSEEYSKMSSNDSYKQSASRSRSRSRSPSKKKHKKKRSRSRERKERKHRSRSRSRSPKDRKRRKRSRTRSSSRSPRRSDKGSDWDRPATRQVVPPNPHFTTPLSEVTAKLPPQLRGQVVAQSILVKPEALPEVINAAVKNSAAHSGPVLLDPNAPRERVKKSRWSTNKAFVPGMPTILPSNLDDAQRQSYLLQLEIEETTRKLRMADFSVPEGVERSPSPEPVYDANGKRLNTREVRKKQELEQLRHEKIQALLKINPAYKPPADYRAPNIRLHDKVWIPQEDHPEINFVGLLIGPRGNTLKALEAETQAKIIIRGKGSIKEGKLGRREGPLPGENEPLHAYITGPDRATIQRACNRINEIVNAALMIPDGQNELRKLQLRELAVLNGTLRPEDIINSARCSNCGSDQHKTWECPEQANVTAAIVCSICGGGGHLARDCKGLRDGNVPLQKFDDEYASLMDVLGEKPSQGPTGAIPGMAQFGTFRQQQIQQQFGQEGGDQSNATGTDDFQPKFFQNRPVRSYKLPDSGSLPPPPAFLSAWRPDSNTYDYDTDMGAYYGYGMPNSMWLPPPPPPPSDNAIVAPVPPVDSTVDLLNAPPPPPNGE